MKKIISLILALAMVLSLGVSVFAEGETKSLYAVLGAAQTVTLPMKTEYELGSEGPISVSGGETYGFAVKVNLEANSLIEIKFYDASRKVDTKIDMYRDDGGEYNGIFSRDSDNYYNNGEIQTYLTDAAGEYYILFRGLNTDEVGVCIAEIRYIEEKLGTPLDFTEETVPTPGENDLWHWDAAGKVLTLKDGFSSYVFEEDEAGITLPAGSTIIVEGKATLYTYERGQNGISCEGALTIKGNGADRSVLNIRAGVDGVYADGDLTVENIAVNIESGSDGFISYGDAFIKNTKLDFSTGDESIDVNWYDEYQRGAHLTIESSTVKLVSDEESMQVEGNITIKNCNTDVYSSEEEGIDSNGNIEIIGGRLVIVSDEDALEGKQVSLTDVVFDIRTFRDYKLISMSTTDGFSLPGTFRLYDIDGNQIYEGEWTDELLSGRRIYVGEVEALRAVSVENEPEDPDRIIGTIVNEYTEIHIGAEAAKKGEENPNTGAEVIG